MKNENGKTQQDIKPIEKTGFISEVSGQFSEKTRELEEYRNLALDKLKQEYSLIPNDKKNTPKKIERIARQTSILVASKKERIKELFLKEFVY